MVTIKFQVFESKKEGGGKFMYSYWFTNVLAGENFKQLFYQINLTICIAEVAVEVIMPVYLWSRMDLQMFLISKMESLIGMKF